eukprot:761443-Hanusia_phi.AAC.4
MRPYQQSTKTPTLPVLWVPPEGPKAQLCARPIASISSASSDPLPEPPLPPSAPPSPPLLPDHFRTSLLGMIAASRHPPCLNLSEVSEPIPGIFPLSSQ